MKHLYNCKTDGDQYRITKFTADLEVESSYLLTETECECPAGHRHSCRHRQMLPKFIDRRATRGQWFLEYATDKWIIAAGANLEDLGQDQETTDHVPESTDPIPLAETTDPMPGPTSLPEAKWRPLADGPLPPTMVEDALRATAQAHGFQLLDLADPRTVHNAIAKAIGELPTNPCRLPDHNPVYLSPNAYAAAEKIGQDMTNYRITQPIMPSGPTSDPEPSQPATQNPKSTSTLRRI